ncbi:hypothetical protein [Acidithiobacillus sulfuriphilus]|uniref:hypothetical protein n=1 Tax=Acidithiobacillus sulfuriphilus TaxID=1867749 RepID=UPI003F5E6F91
MSTQVPSLMESVTNTRTDLINDLYGPLHKLADRCTEDWNDRARMEERLAKEFHSIPYCKYLYAMDTAGIQITANIHKDGLMPESFGRDRSDRPYVKEALQVASYAGSLTSRTSQLWEYLNNGEPAADFLLSEAYISLSALRPSVTAIQLVRNRDGEIIGLLGADFALRNLPNTSCLYEDRRLSRTFSPQHIGQIPEYESANCRSKTDNNIITVISVTEELVVYHGVFHLKIHFISDQVTLWTMDDPYRYRLLKVEEVIDPDICMAYPKWDYAEGSVISKKDVRAILKNFGQLRMLNGYFRLRSASLNIFNGMVGLTFSSEGSHYLPYEDFLKTDLRLWQPDPGSNQAS